MTQRVIGDADFIGYESDPPYDDDAPRRLRDWQEPIRWYTAPVYSEDESVSEPLAYLVGYERAYHTGLESPYAWEHEFKTAKERDLWVKEHVTDDSGEPDWEDMVRSRSLDGYDGP